MTSIEYEVTEEDFRALTRHGAEFAPVFIQARRNTAAWGFILGVLIGGALAGAHDRSVPVVHIALIMFGVGSLFAYFAWRDYPARCERAAIAADPPRLSRTGYGPHRLTVEVDGLHIRSPHITMQIEWSGFSRFENTRLYFFLYVSPIRAFIVPKRGLTAEQLQTLASTFAQHISSSPTAGGSPKLQPKVPSAPR